MSVGLSAHNFSYLYYILLQQIPVVVLLQHLHLVDGDAVETYEAFALGNALIYKHGIDILHVGKADQSIDGGIVTDVSF